jgi:cytochrome b6-f complex iron-sulfur subunit
MTRVPEPENENEDTVGRRAFVGRCACALAGLALGGCASLATRRVVPVDGRIELTLARHPELLQPAGSLRLVADGELDPLYVLALTGGSYSVVSPICTHRGCTVNVTGDRLVCPCHGSTYDRAGKVLKGPAEHPLTRYPARVADGVLAIDLRAGSRP